MLDRRLELERLCRKGELIGLNLRTDANETAQLDRSLRFIETQTYDIVYPELKHRRFIPQDDSVPAGAESILYRQFDQVRNAKIISDFADDLPFADVVQAEFPIPIKPVGSAFKYSLRDLQHAAFNNVPLDVKRGQAARDSVEYELDDIACFGRKELGLYGLLNNPFVSVISVDNYSGAILWTAKTGVQIVKDIGKLLKTIPVNTKQIYRANTVLMSTDLFELIKVLPFSDTGASDRTVYEFLVSNNPGITFDGWYRLDAANAAGTGGRIVAYMNDPRIVQEKNPMPFTQLPPQPKGLAFIINCWALTAATHIYQAGAITYMDGAS